MQTMKSELRRFYKEVSYHLQICYRPVRINLAVTDACNLRCPTCSKWQGTVRCRELHSKEWRLVLRKLKGFALSNLLVISGGEPFCRKDLIPILEYSREMAFQPIVITNGTLIDRPLADRLSLAGMRQITLSLNGIRKETHDPTRGLPGSFEKTMRAVEMLKERGVPVVLETVILKSNFRELEDLVHLAWEKNLKGILFQVLTAGNVHNKFQEDRNRLPEPGWFRTDPYWIDDHETFDRVMNKIIRMKRQGFPVLNPLKQLRLFSPYYRNEESAGRIPCTCGLANFLVDPYGQVRLCYSFEPVGNLLEQEPQEIWRSQAAAGVREKIRACRASCRILNNNW